MMASEVRDFPEPDSPTRPSTSPSEMEKERSLTAAMVDAVFAGARATRNCTVRLRTSSNGTRGMVSAEAAGDRSGSKCGRSALQKSEDRQAGVSTHVDLSVDGYQSGKMPQGRESISSVRVQHRVELGQTLCVVRTEDAAVQLP